MTDLFPPIIACTDLVHTSEAHSALPHSTLLYYTGSPLMMSSYCWDSSFPLNKVYRTLAQAGIGMFQPHMPSLYLSLFYNNSQLNIHRPLPQQKLERWLLPFVYSSAWKYV